MNIRFEFLLFSSDSGVALIKKTTQVRRLCFQFLGKTANRVLDELTLTID
jgi:hypothetical protein